MPNMIPVVLNDGTDDNSFNPRGIDTNGVATLVRSTGVPIGDSRLTVQRSRTSAGREKVSIKMVVPIIASETVGGVARPSVVRVAYADLVLSFDAGSSTLERTKVRNMLTDLLGTGQTFSVAVIDDLEGLF